MPARVIDDFKLIQVEIQQRMRVIFARRCQDFAEAGFKFLATQQTGQRIMRCLVGEFLRYLALFCDIPESYYGSNYILSEWK